MTHLTRASEEVTVFIPKPAQIDPEDARDCFAESWENKRGARGRCPGIGTLFDSDVLICKYFADKELEAPGPTSSPSANISSDAVLYTPDGKRARWGQEEPVRRCSACLASQKK